MGGGFLFLDPSPEKRKEAVTRGASKDVYFEISPVHKQLKKKEVEEDIPVLRLIQFNHPPKISFDTVKLGTTRQRKLHVSNPKNDPQELYCEKPPNEENGFSCSTYRAVIQPAETIELVLTWAPKKEGSVREVLHWKTNLAVRSQIVVMGTCVDPDSKKKVKGRGRSQNTVVGSRTGVAHGKVGHSGKVPSRTTGASRKSFKENLPCKSGPKARNSVDSKYSKINSVQRKETKHSTQILREANQRGKPSFKANSVKPRSMNSTQRLEVSETKNIHLKGLADPSMSSVTLNKDPAYVQEKHMEEFSRYEDISTSDGIDLRRMTYVSTQDTCIVEESEMITEVKEYKYCVTDHGDMFFSHPGQVTQSNEVKNSRMVSETFTSESEEFYTVCNSNRTHAVAPSPLRRQTFITKSLVHDNQSDSEELDVCEDGQLTIEHLSHETPPKFKEMFSEIMSSGSRNEAETVPDNRKTFFKAAHECDNKTENLLDGNTVTSQLRHQTLTTGKGEMFRDIHKGYLPPCHFEDSPDRRQTYIKGTASKYKGTPKDLHSGINGKIYVESPNLSYSQNHPSNASTPCEYKTPAQKRVVLANDVTTITPVPYYPEYFDQIRAVCMDLLEREDDLDLDSVLRQAEIAQKSCTTPELDMHTAPASPSSDFQTAPSTPTDEEHDRLNEIQDVPISGLDDLLSKKTVTLDDLSMLVEMELKSEDNMNKGRSVKSEEEVLFKERYVEARNDEIGRHSSETAVKEISVLCPDEIVHIDEKYGSNETMMNDQQRILTLDDISMLVEMELKSEDNINKDKSIKFEEAVPCKERCLQTENDEIRRLSSETVVKETSILHPHEIVCIDEKNESNEALLKDQSTVTRDDISMLVEMGLKSDGNLSNDRSVKSEEEVLYKEQYLQAENYEIRLSSETSIPHPDEIVHIDEKYGSNETLVKDGPSLPPSMLHHVTDTHTPRRKSTPGILPGLEGAEKIMSLRQSLPVIHCSGDYQSKALDELLCYKNTKGNDLDKNIRNSELLSGECIDGTRNFPGGGGEPNIEGTSPEKESFVLASESDFKFSPNANSRRCSTCIKADPPEDVDHRSAVFEKCRTLFLDLDENQSLASKVSESEISDTCLKNLSTIEEIEEDLSFAFCTKMPDRLRNSKRTNSTFEKTSSRVCENSVIEKVGNDTCETRPLGLTFVKQEIAHQSCREPEDTTGFVGKEETPNASVPVEDSPLCKLFKKTPDTGIINAHSVSQSNVREATEGKLEESSSTRLGKAEDKSAGVFLEISPPKKLSSSGIQKAKAKATGNTGLKFIDISTCVKQPQVKDPKPGWSKRSRVNPVPASKVAVCTRKTTQEKSGSKQPAVVSSKFKNPVKKTSSRAGLINEVRNFKKPEDRIGKVRDQSLRQTAVKKQLDTSRKSLSCPQLGSTISSSNSSLSSIEKNMSHYTSSLSNSSNSQTSLNSSTSSRRSGMASKKSTGLRVPQAKLTLIKMQKTMLVHHPNPYIARNMFYDDRWIKKQVAGFTKWLNFILTPPDEETVSVEASKTDIKRVWNEANKSSRIMLAPSKETLSLRAYTARRKLNQLRRKACHLYQSAECVEFIGKMETAVGRKYLMIRKDRHTHADIGLKQQLLQLVLCYNPLWLRIGLETVYGELIYLESNSDITGLTYFIINRLVNNPDIQSQFAHPSVPHSYRNGYEDALKAFQLKKFLLLVYFLELAKTNRLIRHDPCLFNKNAPHKSSRDILVAFTAEFLSGVGDITKHLAYLGYDVKHKQTLLDEFDYAVTNLAVDLRCGIRLIRVMEMLTLDTSYSKKLRLPAVSRTQKIHNTEIALSAISANGIQDIATRFPAKDIVDGHQEQTLGLLWTIIFKFQLQMILNEETLLEEIEYLRRSLKVRAEFGGEAKKGFINIKESLKELDETLRKPKSEDYLLTLLKAWAMLICAQYAVQVENLSVSFSDGRALCLVLHHYHPDLLPRDLIKGETTQNMPVQGIDLDVSLDDSFSDMTYTDTKEEFQKRLANEKDNFILLGEKVSQLGGVPHLIRSADMINTIPDEKVTGSFLAYLCARLLDLSAEIKAARIIQVAWRKRMAVKKQRELQIQTAAATVIQRWWRSVLHKRRKAQYEKAAVVLQSHWRRRQCQIRLRHLRYQAELKKKHQAASIIQSVFRQFVARKWQQKTRAASVIQNAFRTWQQRKNFLKQQKAVVVIQSFVRMVFTRRRYIMQIGTLVGIQRSYRAKLLVRKARKEFNERMNAVVRIQRWYRMILAMREAKREVMQQRASCIIAGFFKMCVARNHFLRMREAVVIIQSRIRMIQQRDRFDATMRAVMVLQDHWRATLMMRRVREQYLQLKEVVIFLQTNVRAYIGKKKFQSYRRSAVIIQSSFRGWRERQKFVRKREAVKVIQEHWRNYQEAKAMRQEFMHKKRAAVTIQSAYRGYIARKLYQQQLSAVVIIQSHIRMVHHRKKYIRKLKAVKTLQIHLRAWKAMKQQSRTFQMWKTSVVKIQAAWKGFRVRQGYRKSLQAAVVLQSAVRGWSVRKRYKSLRSVTLTIQSRYRAKRVMEQERNKYQQLKSNSIHLQALIRGHLARKRYREICSKIIKTQAYVRGWIQCRQYQKQLKAASVIQEWYRATQAMKKQKEQYQIEKEAAIVIQSYVRMYLHRKEYIRKVRAVTNLQTYVRAWKTMREQQRSYQVLKASVIRIQTAWRGFHARKEYKQMQQASVVLQSAVRSWRIRKYYKSLISATLIIQSRYRAKRAMEQERNKFLQLRESTIHAQALVRGWIQRKHYQMQLKAALVIQRWYRATKVMKEQKQLYQREKKAVIVIQSYARMIIQRRMYMKKLRAIRTLQTHLRAWKAMKEEQRKYQLWKSSVVKIQAAWRGFHVWQHYRQRQQASVVIQSAVRGWCARKHYKNLRSAILLIQSRYRAMCSMKKDRNKFLHLQASTVCLQAMIRGHLARKRYGDTLCKIIKTQAYFRGWMQRRQYQKQVKAAVAIQGWYRATQAIKEQKAQYQREKEAAIFIQSHIRMVLQRRIYIRKRRAVETLQTYLRAWKAMNEQQRTYQLKKASVVKIQAAWRSFHIRQSYKQLQQASIVLQSAVRGWKARRYYRNLKSAAVTVQSRYRAKTAMKVERHKFQQLRSNSIHLQALIRGHLARRTFREIRAKVIKTQAYVRGWMQRRQYLKQVKATVVIQRWYRATRVMKEQKQLYQQKIGACIVIQSYVRMVIQRRSYFRKLRAIKTLQSHLRAWKAMKEQKRMYQLRKSSVVKIQAAWQGFHVRQHYRQMQQASVVLQSAVRGWSTRKNYKSLRSATLTIQSRYRAKEAMKQERNKYQQLRGNTVHLQALIRGHLARKRYRETHTKVVKIQAYVRGWVQCRQYQKALKAATVIQEWYRATQAMKKQKVQYQLEKEAAIVIQSYVRMYLHRKKYVRKLQAVNTLQTCVRAWKNMKEQQRTYQVMKVSAVKIQTAWRSYHARKEYKHMQKASVVLQSAVRGWYARKCYKQLRSAAVTIQSRYQAKKVMEQERRKFQHLRANTIYLQALVRGHLARRRYREIHSKILKIQAFVKGWIQHRQYQKQLKAAIVIQRWYRVTRLMKEQKHLFQQEKEAVIVIQSYVRMVLQRKSYIRKMRAIKTLQTHVRALRTMKEEQRKYHLWKESTVKIQAAWRGFCVRQHYRQIQQASVVLQSAVRGWRARKQYNNVRAAALIIQSRYRAMCSMKKDRSKFLQLQASTVRLQALIRGYLARRRFREKHAKVIKTQAYIRGWIQRRLYQKQVKAAVAIQRWYRATRIMKEQKLQYQQIKWAVVCIQANVRKMITRSQYLKQRHAAVVLQKHIRGTLARSRYQGVQQKVCVIQRYFRTWLLNRKMYQECTEMKKAAVIIQAHYRGHRVRMMLKKMSNASTTIQSWYRMMIERRNYIRKREAALVIQSYHRAYMEACRTRQQYLLKMSACVTIQSFWRMYTVRKRYTKQQVACTTIQRHVRGRLVRRKIQRNYFQKRNACITAQAWVRMFLAKNRYLTKREAALKIQEFYRAVRAGREARRTYQQHRQAAISIQSWYRMAKQRQRFKNMKCAASFIQKYVRGYLQMKKLRTEYMEKREAIILIQSKVHGWLQHRDYVLRKSAAIRIQTWYRTQKAVQDYKRKSWAVVTLQRGYRNHKMLLKARKEYKTVQSSVVILQAFARGMLVRRQLKQWKESAVVIQKIYRMWKTRTLFIHKREAAKKIQHVWRSTKETRIQREEFLRKRMKILTLQSYIRGFLVRRSMTQKHKAATILQAAVRGWLTKRRYRQKLDVVEKIQEYWRGACLTLRCREEFIYKRRAAVILQTVWRGQLARRELRKHKAAKVIQAYVRGWQVRQAVRSKERQEYLCKVARVTRYHTAAITIQRAYRRHVEVQRIQKVTSVVIQKSVQVIQKAWRRKLLWIRMSKERKAATHIQAAWRGYKVRKHMDKRLSHVCERLEKATSKGTESSTIGNRTESAIAFLLKYKDLKHVLMAVMTLDASTRLSPVCCKKLVEGVCLGILNFFLCSANRSVPHIQILGYILDILINLTKYPYSAPYVFEMENIVEVLVRLMNLYHEKGPSLFNKCATLLYLFAISPHPHQDLASKATDALQKLHATMVRKETASLRGKRQAKINLSKCPTPCLVPEWSMKPGQMREFKHPLSAITLLLQKLKSLKTISSGKQ